MTDGTKYIIVWIVILTIVCFGLAVLINTDHDTSPKAINDKSFTPVEETSTNRTIASTYFDEEKKEYYENGQLRNLVHYVNGVPSGKSVSYYENGAIQSEGNYKNGKRDGNLYFYNKGKVEKVFVYSDGVLVKSLDYYENGQVSRNTTYQDTERNMIYVEEYYVSGKIKRKATMSRVLDDDEDYRPIGEIYNYDENGRLTVTSTAIWPKEESYSTKSSEASKPEIIRKLDEVSAILKTIPQTSSRIQPTRRSPAWERGYGYGWDVGYQDAIDGNGAWASYNDAGKGGDFLDGYESGYIDGYENGKRDRDEDDEEIEDL